MTENTAASPIDWDQALLLRPHIAAFPTKCRSTTIISRAVPCGGRYCYFTYPAAGQDRSNDVSVIQASEALCRHKYTLTAGTPVKDAVPLVQELWAAVRPRSIDDKSTTFMADILIRKRPVHSR